MLSLLMQAELAGCRDDCDRVKEELKGSRARRGSLMAEFIAARKRKVREHLPSHSSTKGRTVHLE